MAQDQPIRLGAFAIGPENSQYYYYGNKASAPDVFLDRDTLNLKYKFVKFFLESKDSWIDYRGIKPDSIITRSPFKNFPELATYDGVGSSHGKHDWNLALFKNTGGAKGTDISYYTRNFDWAAFYTGAYNYVWTAEDAYDNQDSFYKYRLAAGSGVGYFVTVEAAHYISNKDGEEIKQGIMAYGPATLGAGPTELHGGYQQETRHRGSQNYFSPAVQNYRVVFTLRNQDYNSTEVLAAIIKVVINYLPVNSSTMQCTTLISKEIFDRDFREGSADTQFEMSYNLGDFKQNIFGPGNPNQPSHLSTMFVVETTDDFEILLKSIEVFDEEVWADNLTTGGQTAKADSNINIYLSDLSNSGLTSAGFLIN